MFSCRLPADLRDRVIEAAAARRESRAELAERAFEAELDRMAAEDA